MKYIFTAVIVLFVMGCQQKEAPQEIVKQDIIKEVAKLKACTKEARVCPNGRSVGRNPNNNCEFDPCQMKPVKKEPLMCTADVKKCPDGSFIGRDHYNNCQFKECPPTKNGRNEK